MVRGHGGQQRGRSATRHNLILVASFPFPTASAPCASTHPPHSPLFPAPQLCLSLAEGDAVFLHLFAAICRFTDDDDFKTAAVSTTDALASATSAPAARRMRLIVRLYNTLSNRCGAKLHSLLNLLKLARESKQLGRLAVFLRDIEGLPARWSLSPEDSRMLLLEAALATDAAQNADLAQSLRTAYLRTFQGCEAAALVEAEPVAIKAATAYIRTPVVSQRSDLTSLDAVSVPLPAQPCAPAGDENTTRRLMGL